MKTLVAVLGTLLAAGAFAFDARIEISATGCFAGREIFSALEIAEKLGFQSVAVMPDGKPRHSLGELPTLGFYDADEAARKRIKQALSRFKRVSIHQAWDNRWRDWIDCASYVGAEIVTIHPPVRKRGVPLDKYLETQVRFYDEVGDYAQRKGVKIGLENTAGSYDDYVRLIKAIKHTAVGATVDVGHCAFFDEVKSIANSDQRAKKLNDMLNQLVHDLGPKLFLFHVHNVRRPERMDFSKMTNRRWEPGSLVDHRCVTEGEIDFPRLFASIKAVGYRGQFELELEEPQMEESAVRSAEYLGAMLKNGGAAAAYVAPMSHLDLTFMGTVEECLSRGGKVFAGTLDLLEKQPDFRFLIEYVMFLEAYRAAHPEQAAKLDEHIRAGRIELGAEWSGIYIIQEDEEDLIRNVLYAKTYARKRYGIELETLQLTDIPGVIPQLPQLCAGLGIRNLVLTRSASPDTLFWYESPGGARVLTWSSKGYNQASSYGIHLDVAAMQKKGLAKQASVSSGSSANVAAMQKKGLAKRLAETTTPPLFYYGSDQWLPPPNLATAVRAWNAEATKEQQLAVATPTAYFRAMRASGAADKAPVLRGELPSTWPYLEPAHAHVSRWDAPATRALDAAERLSTLAWLCADRPYPRTELDALWKLLLLARDHNYGGQGAGGGQARKFAERRNVQHRAQVLASQAMAVIAERVEVPRASVPIVVFNTLNWNRSDVVHAHVSKYQEPVIPPNSAMVLHGPDGQPVPFQITADRRGTLGEFDFAFVARDVPALGYASYTLEPATASVTPRGPQLWFEANAPEPAIINTPEHTLKNEKVQLTIERATGWTKINDVVNGLGLVGRQELPEVCRRPPLGLSVDDPAREKTEPFVPDAMRMLADGPVLTTVAVRGSVLGVPAELRYTLHQNLPWVDVEVRIDWDLLRFGRIELVYQVPVKNARAAYGLPFGAGAFGAEQLVPGSGPASGYGDESSRASWERTREICRWLDIGGVAMATSHRWTRVDDGAVRCCLVRGGRMRPSDPGTNGTELREGLVFNFRFYPHDNSWQATRIPRVGWEATQPLLAYTVNDTWSPKSLPRRQSLVTATTRDGNGDALLTCLKQAEDGKGVVARWYESTGSPCKVEFMSGKAQRVDLQERPVAVNDSASIKGWEIVTFRSQTRARSQ